MRDTTRRNKKECTERKAEAGQSINITAALDNYFTYCAPYFAYAILCYGLGVVMGKLTNLTHVMSLCLESTQEEKEIEK